MNRTPILARLDTEVPDQDQMTFAAHIAISVPPGSCDPIAAMADEWPLHHVVIAR